MLIAELPANGEFIQVIIGGNIERESEINEIFENLLISFKAEKTSWIKKYKIVIFIGVVLLVLILLSLKKGAFHKRK